MDRNLKQPTREQIIAARGSMTQEAAAAIVWVDRNTWVRWEMEGPNARKIPLATWELFLIKTKQEGLFNPH